MAFMNLSSNFTNFYDFNFTYDYDYEPETYSYHYEEPLLIKITRIVSLCGIIFNAAFTVLLVLALIISPKNRYLPRIWLLLELAMAHLAYSTFYVYQHWNNSYWRTFDWTEASCILMLILEPAFDFVAVFGSGMLACHVFMWTYIQNAEKGRRTLIFWIAAEIMSWFIGFGIILAIRVPYIEIVSLTSSRICTVRIYSDEVKIISSFLTFLLPFIYAVLISCLSACYVIWEKLKAKHQDSFALETLSGATQSNPEYFGVDLVLTEDSETSADEQHGRDRESTYWVIFTTLVIIFGLILRLPAQLGEHEFFLVAAFDKESFSVVKTYFMVCPLLKVVYHSFILLFSLILPEIRNVGPNVIRQCKRD